MGLVTNLITNDRELDTLYQISNSINSHLELDEVLGETVRLVHEVTQGDSCLLYLLRRGEPGTRAAGG